MTVIAQDDHLTAGAWAACGVTFSLMLKVNIAYMRGKMSSRFADVTGITASTYKLMDHT